MKKELRIVFMGTPAFAVASLDILVKNKYTVVGVITSPDKPAGRGQKVRMSAVKVYAERYNLPILQPTNLKDPNFIQDLRALNANLQVVVAFRMLPEMVWNMPEFGTFNLHASLLPQYRGAAPINWAIINGEKETGVTTFFLRHAIDTGDVLLQTKTTITEDMSAGALHDQLMNMGAELVLKTVTGIEKDSLTSTPQPNKTNLNSAPKIFRQDCIINWNETMGNIYNHIRGLSPHPTAWTTLSGKTLKIYSAQKEHIDHSNSPGKLLSDQKTFLKVAVLGGYIHLLEVQLEGKKRIPIVDFLKGYTVKDNYIST